MVVLVGLIRWERSEQYDFRTCGSSVHYNALARQLRMVVKEKISDLFKLHERERKFALEWKEIV